MHLRVYRNKHYSNILVYFVSVLNNIEEGQCFLRYYNAAARGRAGEGERSIFSR